MPHLYTVLPDLSFAILKQSAPLLELDLPGSVAFYVVKGRWVQSLETSKTTLIMYWIPVNLSHCRVLAACTRENVLLKGFTRPPSAWVIWIPP